MAAKALNAKNLLALGPDRLAELLIDVTKGRADLQRRLRLELSAHQGSEDVTRDIRKRYASIRQARGYLSRKTHRTFAKEIRSLIALIETRVAPAAPVLAFELLWELLHLGAGVLDRTRDGDILREAFRDAMAAVSRLRAGLPHEGLADMLFDALAHDDQGIFAGGVAALAGALGPVGLEHLKRHVTAATATSSEAAHVPASRQARRAQAVQPQWLETLLRDIADAQGDLDAYIARFSAAQLAEGSVAADIATRLLAAGRAEEALALATRADLEDLSITALEALGRKEELKAALWDSFIRRPDADRLRRFLRLLPDFDDIEAEDAARRIAQQHRDLHAALRFFIDWPDLPVAARLVLARAAELEGDEPDLAHAADALDARFPVAATLLRRALILSALNGRAARHREAALQLQACAAADGRIADHGGVPDHQSFVTQLRRTYAGRHAFWKIVDADGIPSL
ncbi:DUF6880 family protein [Falsirhodobacter deserti]|uniref:DUF6880 family protein n=1 Tax=Falsirhodobacter deserti TaxID=1365611 RepID=UPI000FE326CE|nr:DUF6880 family protein [Falsirhodobacter deserti]